MPISKSTDNEGKARLNVFFFQSSISHLYIGDPEFGDGVVLFNCLSREARPQFPRKFQGFHSRQMASTVRILSSEQTEAIDRK